MKHPKIWLAYIIIFVAIACILIPHWVESKKNLMRCGFATAMNEVLNPGNEIIPFFGSGPDSDFHIEHDSLLIFLALDGYGEKYFKIPLYKHNGNISQDKIERGFHTYFILDKQIHADSLCRLWQQELDGNKLPNDVSVRITITDWNEEERSSYSNCGDALQGDSLVTFYAGNRCEMEATGYVDAAWWQLPDMGDWGVLVVIALVGYVMVTVYVRWAGKKRGRVMKRYRARLHETHFKTETRVYRLDTEIQFDALNRIISKGDKGDKQQKVSEMQARLLEGFLRKENRQMDVEDIKCLLWPDGSGTTGKVHATVKRLRESLARLSDWKIDNGYGTYTMKKDAN